MNMVQHWEVTLNVADSTESFTYTTTFPTEQDGWPDAPETASEAIERATHEAEDLGMRVHGVAGIRHADHRLLF